MCSTQLLVLYCTGYEAKVMGGRTSGISTRHYLRCQHVSGELSGQRFYPS